MSSSEVQPEALAEQRFLNEAMWFTMGMCCRQLWSTMWKEKVLGGSCETFSRQSFPFLSLPLGTSASRCLLWDALPTVKAWESLPSKVDSLKVSLTALFLSVYRGTVYSKKNHEITWWSLIEVLKFHEKHLCNRDNNVLCQEICLCVCMWFVFL